MKNGYLEGNLQDHPQNDALDTFVMFVFLVVWVGVAWSILWWSSCIYFQIEGEKILSGFSKEWFEQVAIPFLLRICIPFVLFCSPKWIVDLQCRRG